MKIQVSTVQNGFTLYVTNERGVRREFMYFTIPALIAGMIMHTMHEIEGPMDMDEMLNVLKDHEAVYEVIQPQIKSYKNELSARRKDVADRVKEIKELRKEITRLKRELKG